MRDSVLNSEEQMEEKVEKVFDGIAKNQQHTLDRFFQRVEDNLQVISSTIKDTKSQVQSFEDQITKQRIKSFMKQ